MATAVVNVRMRQVLKRMMDAGALSPETARSATALGLRPRLTHKQAIFYLRGRGALVETMPGFYYVDEEAVRRTGRLQLVILGIASAGLCLLLLFSLLMGG